MKCLSFPGQILTAYQNYGNPIRTLGQRIWPGGFKRIEVKDRRTGVTCVVQPGAERMFNEIWFDHDYDIPSVPLRAGDVVIDIGGNQGFYACYAAYHGATVFSFEPEERNLSFLRENIARNGFSDRISVIPKAVKKESGTTRFYVTPQMGGGMHTTVEAFAAHNHHAQGSDVPCIRLADHFAANGLSRVRVCKIDCEGAELEIIQSLTPELISMIDGMAIEFHPEAYSVRELVATMESFGTHHLMLAPPKYCERNMLWAVSRTALYESAERWS